MGRVSYATRQEVQRLQEEYGLTAKQAAYVNVTVERPELPTLERARVAGYTQGSAQPNGYERLKVPRIIKGVKSELAKRAKLEAEIKAFDSNPRNYLKEKFIEFSQDPDITPNQTRNLELLGKMEGAFIERVELDAGVNMRTAVFGEVLKVANVSQENE